jgi:lipopolysaccharide/colanic/teichoic acid biosynthesis glycosyltransferase
MKDLIAKSIFVLTDLLIIALSIYFGDYFRSELDELFGRAHTISLVNYMEFYPLYIIPIVLFAYEGIYTYRYDFWHESRLVFKGILFSAVIVFAYLAMTKSMGDYSRAVIGMVFVMMAILIPVAKNICKKSLYKTGLWRKKVRVSGNDPFLTEELYGNPYLGYEKPKQGENPSTVFINSANHSAATLKKMISDKIQRHSEVIFIPLIDAYDMTHSHIYELSNTRTNLIVLQNRLKSGCRVFFRRISDFALSLAMLPAIVVFMLPIALMIRFENPRAPILFRQDRLGKNGKIFVCYKFRTMHPNNEEILDRYLKQHPKEAAYYTKYRKLRDDPRVTHLGSLLRRTSLDELPQIFNIFKQEMSLIGPRPYMLEEEEHILEYKELILSVRPGITGLWQVSGRNELDFKKRIEIDLWYIRNWNLWMDLVILLKSFKTVISKKGAH